MAAINAVSAPGAEDARDADAELAAVVTGPLVSRVERQYSHCDGRAFGGRLGVRGLHSGEEATIARKRLQPPTIILGKINMTRVRRLCV